MLTRFLVGSFVVLASLLHGTQDSILFPTETIRRHVFDPVGEITVVTSTVFDEDPRSFTHFLRIDVGGRTWIPNDQLLKEVAFYFDPPVRILTVLSGPLDFWVFITVRDLTTETSRKSDSTLVLKFDGVDFVAAELETSDGASRARKPIKGGLKIQEANQSPETRPTSRPVSA